MTQYRTFLIDHIDPLGQGVFKHEGEIFFIPKTLPREEGKFTVLKSSKGVNFGELIEVTNESDLRVIPDCPHYHTCNGCSYLHTGLEEEHKFKLGHLRRMIERSLETDIDIELITNSKRFAYRNRVQLHYVKSAKVIGFIGAKTKKIIPIQNCLLGSERIQNKILEFTVNDKWLSLIPKSEPIKGHVEFFEKDGKVEIIWNKKYSDGGFEQVNPEVNKIFLSTISDLFSNRALNILDLFGGAGNLVNNLSVESKLSVDIYPGTQQSKDKLNLNLFGDSALQEFKMSTFQKFDTLFVDPPRSGFTYLDQWTRELEPRELLYVSCHPATMVRDLCDVIREYEIKRIFLLDFFPGTKHFEAAVYLTKKQQ